MTRTGTRTGTAAAIVALAMLATACAGPDESADDAQHTTSSAPTSSTATEQHDAPASEPARARGQQAFLDDLSRLGLPTHTAADTTVEVGVGICRSIADGADSDTILDRIRPLTSALAAQSSEHDTDEVGRAFIDASRAHLCG